MINKPGSESQKKASVTAMSAVISAPAKSIEATTSVVKTATVATTASSASQPVASGIELNIPIEKIEAEKKSTVASSQPPSTAVTSEVREPSSTQSGAKKDKKDKKRKFVRMAAGTVWEDQTLGEWDLGE